MTYLYGYHVIDAVLNHNFRKCSDLFVNINYRENTPDHIKRIIHLAESKNVKIKYLTKEKLDRFTSSRPHNGMVLKTHPRDYKYISQFEMFKTNYIKKETGNLVILLDQIIDPQNLGSIIRSSFFLGVDNILLNKKNKPSLTSAVSKVSSGASECIELYAVKNIKNFVASNIV